jgi:hypothetical protein
MYPCVLSHGSNLGLPSELVAVTFGWTLSEGAKTPFAAMGGPRLEVGYQYLVAWIYSPDTDWQPQAVSTVLPVDRSGLAQRVRTERLAVRGGHTLRSIAHRWQHLKRSVGNLAVTGVDHLTGIVRNRLERIQYRLDLLASFLAHTGLTLEPDPP